MILAYGEYSFSKLKFIKPYLKSPMSEQRSNWLTLFSIEKNNVKWNPLW